MKALGVQLRGASIGGFYGYYKKKYIVWVAQAEGYPSYLDIDVIKADGSGIGEKLVNNKQTLDKVFHDYIKPRVTELEKQD